MALSPMDTKTTPAYTSRITDVKSAKIVGYFNGPVLCVLADLEIFIDGGVYVVEVELPLNVLPVGNYRKSDDVTALLKQKV
jgi:hypothetical protein